MKFSKILEIARLNNFEVIISAKFKENSNIQPIPNINSKLYENGEITIVYNDNYYVENINKEFVEIKIGLLYDKKSAKNVMEDSNNGYYYGIPIEAIIPLKQIQSVSVLVGNRKHTFPKIKSGN